MAKKTLSRFMNRFSVVVIALAVIAVVVATVVVSGSAQAAGPRPFKGTASGIFVGDGGTGTINATHLGEGTVDFSNLVIVFDPSQASPDPNGSPTVACFPVTGGDQTLTAANGDQLVTMYESGDFCADITNPAQPVPVHGNFVTIVTGGTGRFEGAGGQINIEAVAGWDGENVTFSSTFVDDSWIDY